MSEIKTSRPYQERFLDGFDRSQLRQEVQKAKPRRLTGLRRKYAGWALGASLALGGIGIPMKVGNMLQSADDSAHRQQIGQQPIDKPVQPDTATQITGDLATAKQIADQVAGGITSGVSGAVQDVAKTVTD